MSCLPYVHPPRLPGTSRGLPHRLPGTSRGLPPRLPGTTRGLPFIVGPIPMSCLSHMSTLPGTSRAIPGPLVHAEDPLPPRTMPQFDQSPHPACPASTRTTRDIPGSPTVILRTPTHTFNYCNSMMTVHHRSLGGRQFIKQVIEFGVSPQGYITRGKISE